MLKDLIKEQKFTSVILEEPDVMKCITVDGETKYFTLGKEAIGFLYNRMDVPFTMSKKLYETSKDLWLELRQQKLYENSAVKGLSKYRYVTVSDTVIFAIFDESFDDIQVNYDMFDSTFDTAVKLVNKAGVIQIYHEIITTPDGSGSALLLVDLDPIHGKYVAYNGIFHNDCIITLPNPIVETESFFEFMTTFDPVIEESMSIKMSPHTLRTFADETLKNVDLSVREVVTILKKSKVSLTFDSKKNLVSVDLVNSQGLVDFLNSFGIPYKTLCKQENLKKSLTYGHFKFLDLLQIISQNYKLASNLIDSTMIATFLNPFLDQRTDRNITEECIPDIEI